MEIPLTPRSRSNSSSRDESTPGATPSRRAILRGSVLGGAALASAGLGAVSGSPGTATQSRAGRLASLAGLQTAGPQTTGPQTAGPQTAAWQTVAQETALQETAPAAATVARSYDFNQGWLFGGMYTGGAAGAGHDDSAFAPVTLPHTVTPLSWGNWDYATWQNVWIYRKHFARPAARGARVFLDFDGVMTNATVLLNGKKVAAHRGGYLPFAAELTGALRDGGNVLAVVVDARWLDVPPSGSPQGPASVDYLQPGGIYRDVTLRVVPEVFLADVFARPSDVLTAGRKVHVQATIHAGVVPGTPVKIVTELLDGSRQLARTSAHTRIKAKGAATAALTLTGVGHVTLWSPDTPKRYTVRTTLSGPHGEHHVVEVKIGFRKAVFREDGFYLNGKRFKIFGLDRHQLFPYLGMGGPARLQRQDAEILRNDLNCNMVRCSHYPQSPHFLDACDELGLMVWEEPPGWGYVGGAAFQDLVLQNVHDMIVRDRNRPSVIIWATRLNETHGHAGLYRRTRRLAARLDPSRQTSGAMRSYSTAGWAQDVFAYDDYHVADGQATLRPPMAGLPYLVTEAVGALDGAPLYRWTDTGAVLAEQGRMHAQVHDRARSDHRYAGLLGWCAVDYASLRGDDRIWRNQKWAGVLDTFRVAKPGAAFYQSQVSPKEQPVIAPMFFWDFGPGSPASGPGPGSMIATNCDRLELYLDGKHHRSARPDSRGFPSLARPPVVLDLTVHGAGRPELRIDGYVGGQKVATVHMSADSSRDRLTLTADHGSIQADGSDMTRLTFRGVDAYGHQRPHLSGAVHLTLAGPAKLVGDNPFPFGEYGGVGGAFIRSLPGRTGRVSVRARHGTLGEAASRITVTPAAASREFV
jgi:beta-galactosidase